MKPGGKLIFIFGTRPEWIKMLPVWEQMSALPGGPELLTVFTGQQDQLCMTTMHSLGSKPDISLPFFFQSDDPLVYEETLVRHVREAMNEIYFPPGSAVLVQGDTYSAYAGAVFARERILPLIHLEAGLRTYDLAFPFPEEGIRQRISKLADLHLAPTTGAASNLLNEGIPADRICHIGNTIADMTLRYAEVKTSPPMQVLVSCHRRENLGEPMAELIGALPLLTKLYPQYTFTWLRHPNLPAPALQSLLTTGCNNIKIEEGICFPEMIKLYSSALAVITDSGGMQEEALCMGVPTLIYRKTTERQECIEMGNATLCPLESKGIIQSFKKIIQQKPQAHPEVYKGGSAASNACDTIMQFLAICPEYI